MNIQRIFIIALCTLCSFGIISCNKKLDETPKTFISPDQFFKTSLQCTQAVNGVYTSLYSVYSSANFWRAMELGTDLSYTKDVNSLVQQEFTYSAGNTGTGSLWSDMYSGIKNANMVISKISPAPIDENLKSRLIGETKFLRGLYYFILSNTFGDVPLWTSELNIDSVSVIGRSPLTIVRAQIVKDLAEASEVLPASYGSSDIGRATKGAAQTLLAKVYLYQKDWENARKTAQAVYDSKKYKLMSSYADLFDVYSRYKNNSESIFEVQYLRNAGTNTNTRTNSIINYYIPARDAGKTTYAGVNLGNLVVDGWSVFIPTARLTEMFEANDNRKDIVLGYGYNGQKFTTLPKPNRPWFGPKFWDLEANAQASGKNIFVLRYADLLLILAEASNELDMTGKSVEMLNELRTRAGLESLSGSLNKTAIKDVIFKERAIEFVGEFQRRWDLVRWGRLVEAVKSAADDNPKGAANVNAAHDYYPISQEEIIKNPALVQNKGY